jgi:hypothetical protein
MKLRKRMGWTLAGMASLSCVAASFAGRPAQAQMAEGVSETRVSEEKLFSLRDETFGVKPQLGMLVFKSASDGNVESRMMAGATLELNVSRLLGDAIGWRSWYLGPVLGAYYSHIGAANSNFFGAGDTGGGSNLVILPMNLKIGHQFNDAFRVSVHGGGNWVYRSNADDLFLGESTRGPGDRWRIYPNVGADFEFGRKVTLMIRPDFTLTPGDEIFTGTVAVSIPLT